MDKLVIEGKRDIIVPDTLSASLNISSNAAMSATNYLFVNNFDLFSIIIINVNKTQMYKVFQKLTDVE